MRTTKSLLVRAILLVAAFAGLWSMWKYRYPYGNRTAVLPVFLMELRSYADDHGGEFPYDENGPLYALTKLYPKYATYRELAGISGNRQSTKDALSRGTYLTSVSCSWQYWQGFYTTNNPLIAVVWETVPGLGFNGRRMSSGGHTVGFIDGHHEYIHGEDWASFTNVQKSMRDLAMRVR